jgi:carbon storage regulator
MLVITRREGEEVVIGDPRNPIGVVRIASIKGDRVRVAFEFPREIDVHRREVADQILEERPQVIGPIEFPRERREGAEHAREQRPEVIGAIKPNVAATSG